MVERTNHVGIYRLVDHVHLTVITHTDYWKLKLKIKMAAGGGDLNENLAQYEAQLHQVMKQ